MVIDNGWMVYAQFSEKEQYAESSGFLCFDIIVCPAFILKGCCLFVFFIADTVVSNAYCFKFILVMEIYAEPMTVAACCVVEDVEDDPCLYLPNLM